MKTVSFVNVNFQQGAKVWNAYFLPYSAGIVWSYASQFPEIKNNYKLGELIWKRDEIAATAAKLSGSDIVGFSCYVWNRNYSYKLASELKKINPAIKIVFGGPEPPVNEADFFEKLPFIDVMVKSEGEITFKHLLDAWHNNEDIEQIPGLLINKDNQTLDTGKPVRIDKLDNIPSPYLSGVFEKIMAENPEVEWNTILESNRGCPYHCTFCDWGSLTYSKIKKFDLQRIFDEIEWIGKNRCGYIIFADANFGIFPERDKAIAEKLMEVKTKYGFPRTITMSWAKNQKREVIDIVKTFINSGHKMGLNLSVQSLSDHTLDVIKRKNLGINDIGEVFRLCEQNEIPVYTELILGLPGETLQSWKENFWKIFKAGNHTGATVYQAQLLTNAEMNLVQKEQYELKSIPVHDYLDGVTELDELKEGMDVIVSTKDMPADDMLEAAMFTWFINTFHINGITTYLSRFMYERFGIEYAEFYEKLYRNITRDAWFLQELKDTRFYIGKWMKDGSISHPKIAGVNMFGVNLVHRSVINIHASSKNEHILDLIEDFMINEFAQYDEEAIRQLVKFQRNYLISYEELDTYPRLIDLDYDFLGYLQHKEELNNPTTYEFHFDENKEISLTTFCEQIYFGRRRNFGKARVRKFETEQIKVRV